MYRETLPDNPPDITHPLLRYPHEQHRVLEWPSPTGRPDAATGDERSAASVPSARIVRVLDDLIAVLADLAAELRPADGVAPAGATTPDGDTTPPPADGPALLPAPGLSAREREVLRLLAEGCGNADIADRLVISLNTVYRHVNHIFGKLGVANRTEAAVFAHRHGLL